MKDRILMSVTQVIDDDTGIWAGDITDFGIYTGLVKDVLRLYRKKGRDSIQKELDYLKKRVDELWDEVKVED